MLPGLSYRSIRDQPAPYLTQTKRGQVSLAPSGSLLCLKVSGGYLLGTKVGMMCFALVAVAVGVGVVVAVETAGSVPQTRTPR